MLKYIKCHYSSLICSEQQFHSQILLRADSHTNIFNIFWYLMCLKTMPRGKKDCVIPIFQEELGPCQETWYLKPWFLLLWYSGCWPIHIEQIEPQGGSAAVNRVKCNKTWFHGVEQEKKSVRSLVQWLIELNIKKKKSKKVGVKKLDGFRGF